MRGPSEQELRLRFLSSGVFWRFELVDDFSDLQKGVQQKARHTIFDG